MGSSTRKKKEKKKDFQKTKLKVGKAKPKAVNFTDTSFKSKAIVVSQQSLSEDARDPAEQFKHNLSLAATSKSDSQRRDALSFLTAQLSAAPPSANSPVGISTVLAKLLPLISDGSAPVRSQLLKLLRVLPPAQLGLHVEKILMYIRAGLTHLSTEIRDDALTIMEWILESAANEAVSCPGGWVKTLNSFGALLGWNPESSTATSGTGGWTSASKAALGATRGGQSHARQIQVLAKVLEAGFRRSDPVPYSTKAYWDNLYRVSRTPNPFAYLNLFGSPRDEDGEMYPDREARQRVFRKRWHGAIGRGADAAKKEGGAVGRAAAVLDQVLKDGMGDFEESVVDLA